ncbi:MAG: galactokinase [Bacteroidales bacterium]
MNREQLKSSFAERFGASSGALPVYFSPGRVNLIGEHTDYNNGYVLPCALTFGTYLLIRKNQTTRITLASENFEEVFELSLDEIHQKQADKWINYPLGVIDQLRKHGLEPEGVDLLFYGNIPNSAGLSSSASIEMVTAFALNDMYALGLPQTELVKLSQKAENEFVGVNCGIMDQFAVGMGEKNRAVFLDCGTLEYELIPLHLEGHKLVIANTSKSRGLADSKYNERVSECRKAMDYLRKAKNIDSLSDLTYQEFTEIKHLIPDITIRKRAKHVISENQRVLDAVEALRQGNLRLFGKLMNASHNSLRYDYEVTGAELDAMVEAARQSDGVRGARMTGAGFGGCAVALVQQEAVENFIQEVGEKYTGKTGLKAEFYISEIGNGTMRLE